MEGVVSLLDADPARLVEQLWTELAERFGVQAAAARPQPHVSFHVATRYDLPPLREALARVAAATAPLSVRAGGLGVFPGPKPVLYVPVVRDQGLSELHARLWPALMPLAAEAVEHYAPERWLPHITLASEAMAPARLAEIVAQLLAKPVDWQVRLDNLALIGQAASAQRLQFRCPLLGGA